MKKNPNRTQRGLEQPTQTLKEIDHEIARLQERAAAIVATEKAGVIERIKEALAYYNISAADLGLPPTQRADKRKPSEGEQKRTHVTATGEQGAAEPTSSTPQKRRAGAGGVKFKDDAGNAWSGFGPKPKWLVAALSSGKALEDLRA